MSGSGNARGDTEGEKSEVERITDSYQQQRINRRKSFEDLVTEVMQSDTKEAAKLLFEEAKRVEAETADDVHKRMDRNYEEIKSIREEIRDAAKLEYDFSKHLTTLSTGSILVIAAITRAFFPNLSEVTVVGFLYASFLLILASVLFSIFAMKYSIIKTLTVRERQIDQLIRRKAGRVDFASGLLIFAGITSFIIFVLRNVNS